MTTIAKFVSALGLLLLFGCAPTKYIEKQSEPLKQAVYGVNDSLKEARIDLAWYYSNEATRLVNPPTKRIQIKPLYETPTKATSDGKRILVVPETLKDTKVVVIGSNEYKDLVKNKDIAKQLADELALQKKVTEDIAKQKEVNEKNQLSLIDDYNKARATISKKDAAIWHRNFIILGLVVLIAAYIGLRVAIAYGKLSAPFML